MTAASYLLTATAEDDLRGVLQFIARRDGVDRALHVHDSFVETFRSIAEAPDIGFRRPQLSGDRVRWRPVFKWLVIYDPGSRPITILRVIHGARELDRLLGEER